MRKQLVAVIAACVTLAGCSSSPITPAHLTTETFMIDSADPGIRLHVRNKHLKGRESFPADRILLMVHGATFPSESLFDIDLPGGSWMDHAASRGFDTYFVDIRGYGRSTRPAAMDQPPEANPPLADTREAVRDVEAAIEFILARRKAPRLNLLGWSWGATIMAGYAAQHPGKVEKLVLYGTLWYPRPAPKYAGAYRTAAITSREEGIPPERLEEIHPTAWFNKWRDATLATDPVGASRNPPVVRAPNGTLKDMVEFWGAGRATFDPAAIRAPTLLVVGEWDRITPSVQSQGLFTALTHARHKRLVVLSGGAHQMLLQKNRMHLIREVQHFLEEAEQ
jgi:pimeloyl-ACP methyl ester carboxylesterase